MTIVGVVQLLEDSYAQVLAQLLRSYSLRLSVVAADTAIPGSYWGESEAGLIGNCLYVRADTPLHSALHEACHFICMDDARRPALERDAGGDYNEENAVCYLQILLAEQFPGFGSERMCTDMDTWGYTFRLGSARLWFDHDAQDARQWLQHRGLIDAQGRPVSTARCGHESALLD